MQGSETSFEKTRTDVGRTSGPFGDLVQNKTAVLVTLFAVTGFLGLPLLWMNEKFTTTERIGWAVVNIIYTCGLLYLTYWICSWSYRAVMGI